MSALGDVFGLLALSILVFEETNSAVALTGLFVSKQFVPALIAPPIAGRLEALPRRISLTTLFVANAFVYGLLAFVATQFALVLVLALSFVDGVLTLSARAILRGATATVLKPIGELRAGNALLNNGFTVSEGIGPILGGLVVAGIGVSGALVIDAASFLIAGTLLAGTRGLPRPRDRAKRWWVDLHDGVAYIRAQAQLRLLFVNDAISLVFLSAVLPIEVVLVKETFEKGDAELGLFLTLWGVGMVLGGAVFSLLREARLGLLVVVGTVASGVAYVGVSLAPTFAIAAAINLLGGLGNGLNLPALVTALQHKTTDNYQVRVMAASESLAAIMPGVGYALGGAIAAVVSARATFLIGGLGTLVVIGTFGARIVRIAGQPSEATNAGAIGGTDDSGSQRWSEGVAKATNATVTPSEDG